MNPKKAVEILKEGCNILTHLNVMHWLSAGTALGAYRDNLDDAFLERDSDIDVGVFSDCNYYGIRDRFLDKGFTLFRTYHTDMWAQLAMLKDGIIFDIYFFNPVKDQLENRNEHGVMTKPVSMIAPLGTLTVHGQTFNVPNPIEDYLELRYGDWKTPAKEKIPWEREANNLVLR